MARELKPTGWRAVPRRLRIPVLAGTVLAIAAAAFAVFGGSDSTPDATQPTPTDAAVQPLPPGVVAATAIPTGVLNDAALRKQVTLSKCEKTANGWQATGTASNNADAVATYSVTVFFTTASATVLEWGQTEVSIKAGATAEWALEKDFTAPPDTRCVLRGVGSQSP